MTLARSFPPIADAQARLLILGSMPGQASLDAGQYYAHPRNAFWPIMGQLLGFDPAAAYPLRQQRLLAAGVAVWDVLQSCERPGSLDANIAPASMIAHDFSGFLAGHPAITAIFFNGSTAEQVFRRHVLPPLKARHSPLPALYRLPSTSPAHAARSLADKLAEWAALRPYLMAPTVDADKATKSRTAHPD